METNFWLTPVRSWEDKTPEDVIQILVKGERIYALGEKTHGRRLLKPGDWICFYIPGKGIVAHARLATSPERRKHRAISNHSKYPWVFHVEEITFHPDHPIPVNANMRSNLDAFRGRDLNRR